MERTALSGLEIRIQAQIASDGSDAIRAERRVERSAGIEPRYAGSRSLCSARCARWFPYALFIESLIEFSDQFSQLCRILFVGHFLRNDVPRTGTWSRRLIAVTGAGVRLGRGKLQRVHPMLRSADWGHMEAPFRLTFSRRIRIGLRYRSSKNVPQRTLGKSIINSAINLSRKTSSIDSINRRLRDINS